METGKKTTHPAVPHKPNANPPAVTGVSNTKHPAAHHAAKKVTKSVCEAHMHRYVEVQAADGYCYDGIVEHVDDEWVCLAVPGSVEPMRGFHPGPFHPPFGPVYPFRPRRFNRLILPLAGLAAISLLPYYW
ncbi:hypothetical protein ACF3MZ_13080 [Paenibacillaceae bacterium WGS1546]|uniref:hypothetical protein n=1 Tax=Cohnella sp. WGS1546 TaxID=3366810 RepID=UPI00372CFEBB